MGIIQVRPALASRYASDLNVTILDPTVVCLRVLELFRLFFRIAFLASPPQALPAGRRPFEIGVAACLLTYVLALAFDYGLGYALVRAVVDIGVTGAAFFLGLMLVGKQARFQQAYGAYCGAVAFANVAALMVYQGAPVDETRPFAVAEFVLLVWNLALLSHVIRHSFEWPMWVSTVAALVYVYVITGLLFVLLPLPSAV